MMLPVFGGISGDLPGAVELQYAGRLAQRRAGGHHVVDQQNAPAGEIAGTLEGAAHVPGAFLERQVGLRRCRTGAGQEDRVDREAQRPGDGSGNLERLVEAARPQARRVQRQRQDEIVVRRNEHLTEPGAEPGGQWQLMAILERLDQAVDREFVAKKGHRPREGGWILEAGAAALAERRPVAALRAQRRRELRQVARACRAQQAAAAVGGAQRTTAGQQMGGNAVQCSSQRLG